MKKRNIIFVILLLLFIFGSLAAMTLFRKYHGSLTIINNASVAIAKGDVEICSQRFDLQKMNPGEVQSIYFKITSDSQYRVFVQFISGKNIEKNLGYVTNGMNFKDKLLIKDNDIILKRESVNEDVKK